MKTIPKLWDAAAEGREGVPMLEKEAVEKLLNPELLLRVGQQSTNTCLS